MITFIICTSGNIKHEEVIILKMVSTKEHYEKLIEEGNDPCFDSKELQAYMNRWTGFRFLELMKLNNNKEVLEIGIGTGRVAKQVLEIGCKKLVGLDISPKTIERAKENLIQYDNIELIEGDIVDCDFKERFDIAYSVLTFLHIEDKKRALQNIINSLKINGIFLVSIDACDDNCLDYGNRVIKTYPTDIKIITDYMKLMNCKINNMFEEIHNGDKVATIMVIQKVG